MPRVQRCGQGNVTEFCKPPHRSKTILDRKICTLMMQHRWAAGGLQNQSGTAGSKRWQPVQCVQAPELSTASDTKPRSLLWNLKLPAARASGSCGLPSHRTLSCRGKSPLGVRIWFLASRASRATVAFIRVHRLQIFIRLLCSGPLVNLGSGDRFGP